MLLLACEDGGIYTKGGIKSEASRAIGSKEGYEEACEDTYEDKLARMTISLFEASSASLYY